MELKVVNSWLRPREHASVVIPVTILNDEHELLKDCRLFAVIVTHANEGAIFLLKNTSGVISVYRKLAIQATLTTRISQLSTAFSCAVLDAGTVVLNLKVADIAHLQSFLFQFKESAASADELPFATSGTMSHQWMAYYPSTPAPFNTGEVSNDRKLDNPFLDIGLSTASERSYGTRGIENPLHSFSHIRRSHISKLVQARKSEYTDRQNIAVKLVTWNVNGRCLYENMAPLLGLRKDSEPGMEPKLVVLGFQEMDLSAEAYLTTK